MVPRVTVAKKPWKRRPLGRKRKADERGFKKREGVTLSIDIGEEQRRHHARGKFDTISYGRVV